ncbi:cilia- and flagella-associated protein 97-like [Actinia tenebrosa]|uniref:Cilia- and flagella-associated protein 97-like n=1 Tax=Actinia tenebrosa TaxID=6105 RepID=A0A6P8HDR2_ACTTE|nr:cilia- and flagella-associated protein 97-like [Actinia tenebrosa]
MAEYKGRECAGEDFDERNHVDGLKREHFLKPDSDQIDLNLLLKAVLDISEKLDRDKEKENYGDREKPSTSTQHETTSFKEGTVEFDRHSLASSSRSRPRSNYRYSGPRRAAPPERKNLSFSNNKVMDIDRENQRLLQKITSSRVRPKSAVASSKKTFVEPMRVQTAAEVNRTRFQKRVDEDNQKFLQRLQSVKPTKSLSKEYLSKEADAQKNYMTSRARPSSAGSTISRRSRMTHAGSASSLMSSDSASVASSRVSRASSASWRSRKRKEFPKPVWEPGW